MCLGNNAIERAGLVAAVERAADGIVITDVTGTIRYVNPAFTALTGYAKEEAVGQNPPVWGQRSPDRFDRSGAQQP